MSQDDAHNVLNHLAHKHEVNLAEVSTPVMKLLLALAEDCLDKQRIIIAHKIEATDL